MLYSRKQHLFLVVFEFIGASSEVVLHWENTDPQLPNSKSSTIKGRDVAYIGPNDGQFAILDEDMIELSVYTLPGGASKTAGEKNMMDDQKQYEDVDVTSIRGPQQFMFESEVDRIFSTPVESTLMFASHGDKIGMAKLVHGYRISTTNDPGISTKTEAKKSVRLKANEIVLQVHWQETPRGCVAGIMTTHRVLIVSADLDILASSSTKFDKGLPPFRSLLWVGPALLYSTATAINMLGWDGKVSTILSISTPTAVLVGALNDRLLLAHHTEINPRQKKGIEIKNCLVGLLEPLLIGFGTMQQIFEQKLDLPETLYQITSRFDSLRITPRSLDILAGGAPVCGDLAVSLSQSGLQFTQVLRGVYAIKARRYLTALSVLKDEFLRSRDYPQCPPTSHLFHRFRQLGYACIKYGQFDSAKETFEVISDFESMIDLFICHLNPSAMRRLAQRLEEESSSSEVRRYCERILRVRSTGWTQGIFANFAAESMVPKGPEWGGGNWEIKTPNSLKSIPKWDLAAEVMPYMKTDKGSIPTIPIDHIGVYLGLIKGRGNIVEVRDDSLVKTLKSEGTKGASVDDSLMGLEALSKPSTVSASADEQAKAEEEFKRSLYGNNTADETSSDDDRSSKAKKLRIRIKDKPSTPTFDVDKIKEATKQLKLGDGFGPPIHRTRSVPGPFQDLGLTIPPSDASRSGPATMPAGSTPAHPFGTGSWAQTGPVATGAGGATRPIPEDFFQNTIPSLEVAAALPPPGSFLSRYDQYSQSIRNDTNQAGFSMSTGLPNDAIPPQSMSQTVVMPQHQVQAADAQKPMSPPVAMLQPRVQAADVPIPMSQPIMPPAQVQVVHNPKSMSPPVMAQPQVQADNVPVSTQPLDLSPLGGPGSANAAKASKPCPPASVHPGQVTRGAPASVCFKTGLAHLEQNQLPDAMSCFDEAFVALAKDQSRGADVKAQATICAQYKITVTLLQEINRLQRVQGPSALSAKDETARLSRHLGSLPLQAKHRINCVRTAIKRNMDVQNYGYAKQMLVLLLSKAPPAKQAELRSLIDICDRRGLTNRSIDPLEDPSQFCAATLSRLPTIGHDICDLCGAKFSALAAPGCIVCGMGSVKRSDALAGPALVPSPFG